jgi:hypothetical protein
MHREEVRSGAARESTARAEGPARVSGAGICHLRRDPWMDLAAVFRIPMAQLHLCQELPHGGRDVAAANIWPGEP